MNFQTNLILNLEEFITLINYKFPKYSMYIHGINPKNQQDYESIAKSILKQGLKIQGNTIMYGMAGTVQPYGLVEELSDFQKPFKYIYSISPEGKVYNAIILIPQVFIDNQNNEYYVGYARANKTDEFPKNQPDFDCLLSDIISEKFIIAKEFIIGYEIWSMEDESIQVVINPSFIGFQKKAGQQNFFSEFLPPSNSVPALEFFGPDKNLELLKEFAEIAECRTADILSSQAPNKREFLSSVENTALEYFEYSTKSKAQSLNLKANWIVYFGNRF